jgi:hypothetical protein
LRCDSTVRSFPNMRAACGMWLPTPRCGSGLASAVVGWRDGSSAVSIRSEAGIAIELDGGGHAMSEQAGYDQERERQLSQNGIRVLRFWDDQALKETDTVLEIIAAALETAPHPTLSPKGGEGKPSPLLNTTEGRDGR